MKIWQKEIMKLANDFCLNTEKVKEIVNEVNKFPVSAGINEFEYKYKKAYSRIKPMIMKI